MSGPSRPESEALAPWIVQLHCPFLPEAKADLKRRYGLRLDRYKPERAYLERLEPRVADRARADPLVRAVVYYRPEFKITPTALSARQRSSHWEQGIELVARLFDDADPDPVSERLAEIGATEVHVRERKCPRASPDRARSPDGRKPVVCADGPPRAYFRLRDLDRLDDVAEISEVVSITVRGRRVPTRVSGSFGRRL